MSYFLRHMLICCNERGEGEMACQNHGALDMLAYAKNKAKDLGIDGPGKVRINKSGCLGRCDKGPVAVVYPDAVWYTFIDEEDMAEIVTEHLQFGRVVERLKID